MADQDWPKWKDRTIWGIKLPYAIELSTESIEEIAHQYLNLHEDFHCLVSIYRKGAFSNLYKVESPKGCFLLRASLPLFPKYQTESEVATIRFLQQRTDIPVPKVIAYDSSSKRLFGFEWILMEMVSGTSLDKTWETLSFGTKQELVQQIAHYQSQLFRIRCSGIGKIILPAKGDTVSSNDSNSASAKSTTSRDGTRNPKLGRIVGVSFCDGQINPVPRDPLTNSADWLRERLGFDLWYQRCNLKKSKDEDEIKVTELMINLVQRLLERLPRSFTSSESVSMEPTRLCHSDLHFDNILVDDNGKLTAIIDWGCISAMPLWGASRVPKFLNGCLRDERPDPRAYYGFPPDLEGDGSKGTEQKLDNVLYWEHFVEYERAQLRRVFIDKMTQLEPEWIREHENEENDFKAQFDMAANSYNNRFAVETVGRWLDDLDTDKRWSLWEELIKNQETVHEVLMQKKNPHLFA